MPGYWLYSFIREGWGHDLGYLAAPDGVYETRAVRGLCARRCLRGRRWLQRRQHDVFIELTVAARDVGSPAIAPASGEEIGSDGFGVARVFGTT